MSGYVPAEQMPKTACDGENAHKRTHELTHINISLILFPLVLRYDLKTCKLRIRVFRDRNISSSEKALVEVGATCPPGGIKGLIFK